MNNLSIFVLHQKMKKCWAQDPDDRPSFLSLSNDLEEKFERERIHRRIESLTEKNTKEGWMKEGSGKWNSMDAGEKRKQIIANRKKKKNAHIQIDDEIYTLKR